jgi:hypothetical protein
MFFFVVRTSSHGQRKMGGPPAWELGKAIKNPHSIKTEDVTKHFTKPRFGFMLF